MDHLSEQWVREAERLHRRYLTEVVEAFGLCPWAERARRDGRTRVEVVLDSDEASGARSTAVLGAWASDESVEIGFLLFPCVALGRIEFDRLVAHVRSSDAQRHRLGQIPFALAAFHPEGEPDLQDADRLIPFLRRTPDPCIQAVRMSVLERVRGGAPQGTQFVDIATLDGPPPGQSPTPPLRERIARANLDTVLRLGLDGLTARIEAIQDDRARTYAALGVAPARRTLHRAVLGSLE
jgi:hypothetical protein